MQPPLVVILGPTAVGKTELSLQLCEAFAGEVIGADSRQLYRGMDIGTAKATLAEQQRVPHHLIDLRAPDETLTVAEYQQLAYATINDCHRRERVPFLVGGTALYIRAVVQGLHIPAVPPNPALRAELEEFLAAAGRDALFARLQELDPASAAVIDGQNPRRVLRALEIILTTGHSKTALEGATPPPYRVLLIGLDRARDQLYTRVNQRVVAMLTQGLIQETERLLALGYAPTLPAMTSLGYREITAYLQGELTLAAATEKIKHETHRYVRYQYTAFRKLVGVHWFDLAVSGYAEVNKLVGEVLSADFESG